MITKEKLAAVNKSLQTVNIKGKQYAMVAQRVQAFRDLIPHGTIDTIITDMNEEYVAIQAKIYDEDDHLLASGTAEEKAGSTTINQTSYVENCETSAVGRALGFLGIGSEANMASAEEVATAILNQIEIPEGKKILRQYCDEKGLTLADVWNEYGLNKEGKKSSFYMALAKLMEQQGE